MTTSSANLGYVKLVTDDLEKSVSFYTEVFALTEAFRVEDKMAHRPMKEVIFQPAAEGAASFVVMKFLDGTTPGKGQVVPVFVTDDLDSLVARAQKQGVKMLEEPNTREGGAIVAFFEDPEGNLVEAVQMPA